MWTDRLKALAGVAHRSKQTEGAVAEGFVPYVAHDRHYREMKFDVFISDKTAEAWYGNAQQWMPEREWCENHILPGMTVVDCGAHHGLMTILFSRWVGPTGRVVSYEIVPANAKVIEENLRLNAISNVRVRPVGVSARNGVASVHINEGNAMVSDLSTPVQVNVVRLDDDLEGVSVDFLKLDVEGSDLLAIQGAARVLDQRPIVDLELHNFAFAERVDVLRQIFSFLPPQLWKYEIMPGIFDAIEPVLEVDCEWLAKFDNPHVFLTPIR
jgi:FkbM family methyltransferase